MMFQYININQCWLRQ